MFDPNPLSLSVPEPQFESWLRDSGYLEILDQRSTDLHRLSTAPKPSNSAASAESATTSISSNGAFLLSQLFSRIWTLLSLLTINPFSKLATNDFSGDTPPWTLAFFGSSESYSFPSSPSQARLRVHENVKRFARNYTTLFVLFFACSLYPLLRQTLIRIAQCLAGVILFISNVQFAMFCAVGVSYAGVRQQLPVREQVIGWGCRRSNAPELELIGILNYHRKRELVAGGAVFPTAVDDIHRITY
ncbi:hypothetical protein C2S51_009750, partial [Perilla frutescens var. frutescens]